MNRVSVSEAVVSPVRMGWLPIGALGILALALGTLQSVVEPALPLLQRELGVSPAEGALIGNALLITGAVITPVAGKLGDRYGGKRVLVRLMAVVSVGGLIGRPGAEPAGVVARSGACRASWWVRCPSPSSWCANTSPQESHRRRSGWSVALFTGGSMVGTLFAGADRGRAVLAVDVRVADDRDHRGDVGRDPADAA